MSGPHSWYPAGKLLCQSHYRQLIRKLKEKERKVKEIKREKGRRQEEDRGEEEWERKCDKWRVWKWKERKRRGKGVE